MYYALNNGGPNNFIWGLIVVFAGALAQAALLGEIASILPMAGAQYPWTHHLASPGTRRFATWAQGWATWFGYVSLLAGTANYAIVILEAAIPLNYPEFTFEGWHTALLVICICVVQALMNMYAFWLIPWVELVAGVLHVALFVIFVVVLAALETRHSADFVFLSWNISSGWENGFVSWNCGLLSSVWLFNGKFPLDWWCFYLVPIKAGCYAEMAQWFRAVRGANRSFTGRLRRRDPHERGNQTCQDVRSKSNVLVHLQQLGPLGRLHQYVRASVHPVDVHISALPAERSGHCCGYELRWAGDGAGPGCHAGAVGVLRQEELVWPECGDHRFCLRYFLRLA